MKERHAISRTLSGHRNTPWAPPPGRYAPHGAALGGRSFTFYSLSANFDEFIVTFTLPSLTTYRLQAGNPQRSNLSSCLRPRLQRTASVNLCRGLGPEIGLLPRSLSCYIAALRIAGTPLQRWLHQMRMQLMACLSTSRMQPPTALMKRDTHFRKVDPNSRAQLEEQWGLPDVC